MSTDDTALLGLDPLWGHPLVARLARGWQRLRRADQDRPWVLDTAVVVVVVLLFCLPQLVHHSGQHEDEVRFVRLPVGSVLALQAGLVLPLLWRRRAPFAAFSVVVAVFVLQWALGPPLHADIALIIALYSLALHGSLRKLTWACALTGGALLLVAARVSVAVSLLEALFFLFSTVTAAVALGLAVRIRRAQLAALRDRAARLEIERDQRSRLAAAAERTQMAREMHDIIGHNLSVIIGLADGGAYAADVAPQRSKEALELIAGTGRQALRELRRMLGVLREAPEAPELTPQPGIADVDALCARIRAAGPQVVYRSGGDMESLDRGVQLAVFRIVQEALTNTLKHAGTDTRAHVILTVDGQVIRLVVEDTGPAGGARHPATANEEGHGLSGMRERAALYGGTVAAGPRPGGGWIVEAVLDAAPLPDPAGGAA
ncbi:sensor histidine kinase [Peterkaempfera sp. SMS 1(5)a]|uniref:sensor histidine kinase n=1 Tax=Peterkaempfera podocarpi TaxID=3232308 RepID=UPI003670635D